MAVIRCKMCGGSLRIEQGETVYECEYCGTRQTVPNADDEKEIAQFTRAGRLLLHCEFDKAAGVYESIAAEFPEEAEAYWCLVLSKYGIEYVDDPATGKKVPTCHRSGFESVMEDPDFELACENADAIARREYRDEAKQIEELRRSIIEVSSTEQPYDIFISYKEKDDNGERTLDSVLAQDIYDALTDKGYRVFFSRISLEDRLGTEYEPYIFAALNSAKVMLVVGTDYDYFNAVWVKNEWSRYLKLMAQDKTKHLIPCFKGIDAYDMPKEFNRLTAQDLGKLGATQDLLRGIDKLLGRSAAPVRMAPAQDQPRGMDHLPGNDAAAPMQIAPLQAAPVQSQTIVQQVITGGATAEAKATRGNIALEDHEWEEAGKFFENALDLNPRCAEAYMGRLLVKEKAVNMDALFTMYKNKYSKGRTDRLEACPEDTEHINKAIADNRFCSAKDIREEYTFDRGFDSETECRREQKTQQLRELDNDRLLRHAREYAAGEFRSRLEQKLAELTGVLDQRIAEAESADGDSIARVKSAYSEAIKAADERIADAKESCYRRHVYSMDNSVEIWKLQEAEKGFLTLHEFKDSADCARQCREKISLIEEKQRESYYNALIRQMDSAGQIFALAQVRSAFLGLKGYKDAEDLAQQCQDKIDRLKAEQAAEAERKYAEQRAEAEHKEAKWKAEIERKAQEEQRQQEALTAAQNEFGALTKQYADLEAKVKEEKAYLDSLGILKWKEKKALQEKIDQLYAELEKTNAERDKKRAELRKINAERLKSNTGGSLAGQTIQFGRYRQNDRAEKIEWLILEEKPDGQMLLLSKYALDCKPYDVTASSTWESCSLRKWLNDVFYNTAFNVNEQAMIIPSTVKAEKNPDYSTPPGNTVQDKVFLLSIKEVNKYLSPFVMICKPSGAAAANGATGPDKSKGWWWLRSPGYYEGAAAVVRPDGTVSTNGNNVCTAQYTVRPAMWIQY